MTRALGALCVGAFLTLTVGALATGTAGPALLLGAAFMLVGTFGFAWVIARGSLGWSFGYVAVQLPLAVATFAADPSVGSTLMLVALVSQCVLLLPLPATAVVIALVPFVHLGMPAREALREGSGLLASVLFGALVTELLRRERRARTDLAAAHARLRDYAAQAEHLAAAQERNRVARDIHDGLGHLLTVVQMQVKAARAVLPTDREKADEVLAKAQRQAEEALAEVRRSVSALRATRELPPLAEAMGMLAEETSAAGVPTRLTVSGAARSLPDPSRETLYRAAQEGLTNVRKHAGASHAELVLDYAEEGVRVEVRDDGPGMDAGGAGEETAGFGLVGLRERAAQVGGRLEVTAVPGRGHTLTMVVPG